MNDVDKDMRICSLISQCAFWELLSNKTQQRILELEMKLAEYENAEQGDKQ